MRTRKLAATLVAAAAFLAACSGSGSDAAADFNDADVTFAQDMIPHHRQATEMASLAASRTETPEILDLADRISAAQDPEIDTMTGWLESWGEEVPGDMSGMEMSGMMSPEEMTQLENASGAEFDRLFLEMMVVHHEGAIEMARVQQENGSNPDAVALAEKIEKDQAAEIEEMRELLAG